MGLDQFLVAKRYYSDGAMNTDKPDELDEFKKLQELAGVSKIIDAESHWRYMYLQIGVGKWRKANHVHKFFVDNVQRGEDNCGTYDVSRGDLEQLLKLCEQVLKDPTKADELLPRSEGCFFGSEEYDEWYFADIDYTVDVIKRVLENCKDYVWSFEYSSSW